MQPLKSIKLGIIGTGAVTVDRHIPSIGEVGDPDVELAAVADTKPGLAEKVAGKFGLPHAFSDYKELLAMDAINAVSICTPTTSHRKIAIEALKAGKNVYLEKPAALNEAEFQEILNAAEESGKVFIVGSNRLLESQMKLFKSMIEDKSLGEVYNISVFRTTARGRNDKKRKTIGKDHMSMDGASHNIEWALWLLDDPKPVSVTGLGYYKHDNLTIKVEQREPGEAEDTCLALIRFDNGSSLIYKALRSAVSPMFYELGIQGDRGSIIYDVDKCYNKNSDDCIRIYTQNADGIICETKPMIKCGRTHATIYRHFFQCIHEGRRSEISDGKRSLQVMRLLDALRVSIQNNGMQVILS